MQLDNYRHMYPSSARLTLVPAVEEHDDDCRSAGMEKSIEDAWRWRRMLYGATFAGMFLDAKFPRIIRTMRDPGYYGPSPLALQSHKVPLVRMCTESLKTVVDSFEREVEVSAARVTRDLEEYLQQKATFLFVSPRDDEHAISPDDHSSTDAACLALKSLLLDERRRVHNRSLRGLHRIDTARTSVNNQLVHVHTKNPFDVMNRPSMNIPLNSELGIYLPPHDSTVALATFVITSASRSEITKKGDNPFKTDSFRTDMSTSSSSSEAMLSPFVHLLDIWSDLFVPLSQSYRLKLWMNPRVRSLTYCASHGFDSSQDMADYLLLVCELMTLYFCLRCVGSRVYIIDDAFQSSINLTSAKRQGPWGELADDDGILLSPLKACAKLLPYGINDCFQVENTLEIWEEDNCRDFLSKYASYMNVDVVLRCLGIRRFVRAIGDLMTIIANDPAITIAATTITSALNDLETKERRTGQLFSVRAIIRALTLTIPTDSGVIFSAIFARLGSVFRRGQSMSAQKSGRGRLGSDLARACFPYIGPWLVKYILFGDLWSGYLSSDSENVDEDVRQWRSLARVHYTYYLESIVHRFRLGKDESIVEEWIDLLFHHRRFPRVNDPVGSRESTLLEIFSKPKHFVHDSFVYVVKCRDEGFIDGALQCIRQCLVQGRPRKDSEMSFIVSTLEHFLGASIASRAPDRLCVIFTVLWSALSSFPGDIFGRLAGLVDAAWREHSPGTGSLGDDCAMALLASLEKDVTVRVLASSVSFVESLSISFFHKLNQNVIINHK